MIDYKLQNKIILRNFSESSDKHDVIKTLLYRMLRRKYKGCPIYTEYQLEGEIPDIYLDTGKGIIIFEIQKEISPAWLKEMFLRYGDVDLIVVPVKELSDDINELREELNKYI